MKNKVKKNKIKILSKSMFFILTLALLVLSIAYIPNSDKAVNGLSLKAGTWKSDLVELDNSTAPKNTYEYFRIKDFITLNDKGQVTEVIDPETKIKDKLTQVIVLNDGLDIYYFSEVCNKLFATSAVVQNDETPSPIAETPKVDNPFFTKYLTLTYVLGADIDYEDASKTYKMLRPIGYEQDENGQNIPFSGVFDGRGFTISNIFYRPFENAEEFKFYYNLVHIAWFANNTGMIMNLGLINPNVIQYDIYEPAVSVTPFIGANNGTVKNCFVQDLRGNNSGLLAEGGYDLTMFAAQNNENGTISNCYVAANRISSTSVTLSTAKNRFPFVKQNSGVLENCYYDESLLIASRNIYSNVSTPENAPSAKGTVTPLKTEQFLTSDFNYASNVWHSDFTYGSKYAKLLKLKYPVLKGFTVEQDKKDKVDYFLIEDAADFVYMSQLIDLFPEFRSASYKLTTSIDLKSVKEGSFVFTNSVFTGTLKGATKPSSDTKYDVKLADGKSSNNYSILNLKIDKGITYSGNHCYGLFGILSGTVENINIVNATINQHDITTAHLDIANAVGTVCGLLINGTIKNVNVYTNITLESTDYDKKTNTSTISDKYIGVENAGGICGASIGGSIQGCTALGTIKAKTYAVNDTSVNFNHSIGGIVGKVYSSKGINDCLSDVTITAPTYTTQINAKQYIGGVIGSGNLKETYKLQNNADIIIPNSNNYNSIMYIGGVIGRVESALVENGLFFNNGNIEYHVNDNNHKVYISGVMNIISNTGDMYDAFNVTKSATDIQNEINATDLFEFKSVTNAGTLKIINDLTNSLKPAKYEVIDTSEVTNGLDVRSAGIAYSYLTNFHVNGAYNLNYHYERGIENKTLHKVENPAQEIDISLMDEYGPTFNADNKVTKEKATNEMHLDTNAITSKSTLFNGKENIDIESYANLETVYNYRDINYITTKVVLSYMLQLSGSINGRNFNLSNIRNDGNIKVYFTNDTGNLTEVANTGQFISDMLINQAPYFDYFKDYKKLKVYGVMEEVSYGYSAKDIYNGGNIIISANGVVPNYNMYISGICYKNVGKDITLQEWDKTHNEPYVSKLMIKRGYKGSLHNCINNGDIRITKGDILTQTQTEGGQFFSQSRVGGICSVNCSTISSTFNLGNVFNINNVMLPYNKRNDGSSADTYYEYNFGEYGGHFEVETGGICFNMQNEKLKNGITTSANIIDSANNGTIISMNSNNVCGWVNAGGFIGRNDRGEDNNTVDATDGSASQSPHKQKIQYSINYGDIIAYNTFNDKSTGEQQSKASGFICLGACSLVDVINYGNIYGNRVASGTFGYIMMSRMTGGKPVGASKDSPIYIANAINYGKAEIIAVNDANATELKKEDPNKTLTLIDDLATPPENKDTCNKGALIGVMESLSNDVGLQALKIKNLVNFNAKLNILGATISVSGNFNGKTMFELTQYMATANPNDQSPIPFRKGSKNGYNYGVKSYSMDTAEPDLSDTNIYSAKHNGGIYNESYELRTAPEPTYVNGEIDSNNTDNFISDYIQFIPYSKVNDPLLEKIGLKSIVIKNSFENAKKSYVTINTILKHLHKNVNGTELDSIYETLIGQYSARLSNYKVELINAIEKDMNRYTDQELKDILKILLQNTNEVNAICQLQDVKNIISSIIDGDGLTPDEINAVLREIIGKDNNLETILNNPQTFYTYIDLLSQSSSITNDELAALNSLYKLLVTNEKTRTDYINSLTADAKTQLSNQLYELLKTNTVIRDALATQYFDGLSFNIDADVTKVMDVLIPTVDGQNTKNNDVTEAEYNNMYGDFAESLVPNVKQDVIDAINGMKQKKLQDLLTKIDTRISDTNSSIYKFFDDRRNKTTGLILPTSIGNYNNLVANYTNENGDKNSAASGEFVDTNWIYTGTFNDINGGVLDLNAGFLETPFEEIMVSVGFEKDNRNKYTYFTYDKNSNTFKKKNRQNKKPTENYFLVYSQTGTGIYAKKSLYNFEQVTVYKYIDYGQGATAKNNKDLTQYMIKAMLEALKDNANLAKIKSYLVKLCNAGAMDNLEFINLVIPNKISTNFNDVLNYLKKNINTSNIQIVKKYLKSNAAKADIVDLFITDHSAIYNNLLVQLAEENTTDKDNFVKTNVGTIFSKYSKEINNNQDLKNNIKTIFNGVINNNLISDKKAFIKLFIDTISPYILTNYSDKLTKQDLINVLTKLVNENPGIINNQALNAKFDYETKAMLISYMIINKQIGEDAEGSKLFADYIFKGSTNDENTTFNELVALLTNLGLDPDTITDFTGIYAMASSHGIEDGLFLPDNIQLNDIDPIDENGNKDHTWRGGTVEEPNSYTTDAEGMKKVNYKVYYQMKQLKKSIATKVFEIELTDIKASDEELLNDPNLSNLVNDRLVVKNNIDTDYVHDSKQGDFIVNFYIPLNHDILQKPALYINKSLGHYELSYGADFDLTDDFELTLPGGTYTASKTPMTETFMVQAEDTKVKTTYTINVYITEASKLIIDNTTPIIIGDNTNSTITQVKGYNDAYIVNNELPGYNSSIRVNYNTQNMANGLSLLPVTNVYKLPETYNQLTQITNANMPEILANLSKLRLGLDYTMPNNIATGTIIDNGVVVIDGVKGTGFNPSDNTYSPGKITFGIKLDNYQTTGIYLLEVAYSSKLKYYTFFKKAPSNQAILEELSYNGNIFKPNGVQDNSAIPARQPYGTPLTEAQLKEIVNGKPTYLDDIILSPLATVAINSATWKEDPSTHKKTYLVNYTITAEDGQTSTTFTHHITEYNYNTYINAIYIDGRLEQNGPITKPADKYIFEGSFEKYDNPAYKFEYALNEIYSNGLQNAYSVVYCDAQGVEITDQKLIDEINKSVTINITQGRDFEIIFNSDAISQDYYFKLKYNNTSAFKSNDNMSWNVDFDIIKISKFKNRDSYIDNIVFSSENVIASTRTMIDVKDITYQAYKDMLNSPYRPIVTLPGKIHYNEYEYDVNKQSDFYVIGLVNKTMLDFYSPSFALPEGAKIYRTEAFGTTYYNYVPYYVGEDQKTITSFLISEDGTKILDPAQADHTITDPNNISRLGLDITQTITKVNNLDEFTYNGVTYKVSPVSGYSTITIIDATGKEMVIENTSLLTNYNENGCFVETPGEASTGYFKYVTYRSYAEIYDSLTSPAEKQKHVTNYNVATQDITNNIRFEIIINKVAGCGVENASYNVYAEFICYTLMEGKPLTSKDRNDFELNNRAGLFAYYNGTDVLDNENLQSNTSGWYQLNLFLPVAYTYTYKVTDGNKPKTYGPKDEFFIENSIVAKTIKIEITIQKGTVPEDFWGVHHEDDSIVIK